MNPLITRIMAKGNEEPIKNNFPKSFIKADGTPLTQREARIKSMLSGDQNDQYTKEEIATMPKTPIISEERMERMRELVNPTKVFSKESIEALGENYIPVKIIIPIKQLLLEGYSYEEVLEESIAKKLAAGAVAAGLVASAPHAVKTINTPSKVDSSYSIGNKNQHQIPGSEKLKELGVKAPAGQYGTIKAQK